MQAKAKRGHHYQTSFTRNVKGISLSEKEETTTKYMKMTKKKKWHVKSVGKTEREKKDHMGIKWNWTFSHSHQIYKQNKIKI